MASGGKQGNSGTSRATGARNPAGTTRSGRGAAAGGGKRPTPRVRRVLTRPVWLSGRIERLRGQAGGQPTVPVRKKRVSRYERDRRRQRILRTGIAIAGGLVLLTLLAGALNEFVLKPRQTVASVNGIDISRSDYWKVRAVDLLEQSRQYLQFADMVGPDQSGQYLQLAEQARSEVPEVWGSTDLDQTTLTRMIDDQLYLQGIDDLGLTVAPEEVETWMLRQFEPADAPLETPTPAPTLIPERAAAATGTAEAIALEEMGLPGFAPTPAPMPPPPAVLAATPNAAADDADEPLDQAAARATAEAGLAAFEESFFAEARISRADFRRLVAVPAVASEEVETALTAEVGQEASQVKARHILVATEDLARETAADLEAGADFADLARSRSTDESTAGNGGDLGWFVAEEMVEPFAEAAFALQPGETSEPFETEFGWHIVRVEEVDPSRPLTDEQITRIEQARIERWLEEQRQEAAIASDLGPTPTPFAGSFQPPIDAPPPPLPTIPPASPVAPPPEEIPAG